MIVPLAFGHRLFVVNEKPPRSAEAPPTTDNISPTSPPPHVPRQWLEIHANPVPIKIPIPPHIRSVASAVRLARKFWPNSDAPRQSPQTIIALAIGHFARHQPKPCAMRNANGMNGTAVLRFASRSASAPTHPGNQRSCVIRESGAQDAARIRRIRIAASAKNITARRLHKDLGLGSGTLSSVD